MPKEEKDINETPASLRRKQHAKNERTRIKDNVVLDEWYEQNGNKIIRKTRKKNGNVYSLLLGYANATNQFKVKDGQLYKDRKLIKGKKVNK